MIDWEEESVATHAELMKRLIDTVGVVVLGIVVLAALCLA